MNDDTQYIEKVTELYVKKGWGVAKIRDSLNISESSVRRIIANNNLRHETTISLFFEEDGGKIFTDAFRLAIDSIYDFALYHPMGPINDVTEIAKYLHIDRRLVIIAFKELEKEGRMDELNYYVLNPNELVDLKI